MSSSTLPAANPVRGRVNAGFFSSLDGYLDGILGSRKAMLFSDLPPSILELGSGTGANFRYFPRGTRVTAVEPNPYMHKTLRRTAARQGIELEVLPQSADSIGLEDQSVDAVVSTLLLCTVQDPEATVKEVYRLLRPGGRFYFLEHVAAPAGSSTRRLQEAVSRPWAWFFEGCHTHRNTLATLEGAGFEDLSVEHYRARSPFLPVNPQIAGVARKG